MKKIIVSLVFVFTFINKSNATQWMSSFEDARKMAISTNKLILVDFWAIWCGPCKRMDSESWSDAELQGVINNFIPLKIDIDTDKQMSKKYSVRGIPYVFILDPNGEIVFSKMSYMNKNEVKQLLNKFSVNTALLQSEFTEFYKNRTGDSTLDIANKYFDYSLFVDKALRNNFLKLGSVYLKKAKNLFENEGRKKKESQKIGLLGNVYKKLIQGKYEKSLKMLNKFKGGAIEEKNKPLYDFLNFAIYNKLENKEQAKLWYEKLKKHKDAKLFLMKSRKV
ncbi:thioredoxin family protein [Polaribacter sp. Asnod1-A03]|uniref:thioredoxin family protein n=1 Tax=Polaribacter sp. Asnod1-A03 TaxID=3160581 RepID=UPI00386E3F0B